MTTRGLLGLVASGCGGVESWFRTELAEPAVQRGWRLAITLTPAVVPWFEEAGELAGIQALTDLEVRWNPRLPSQPKPYPTPDAFIFAPASANSVAKLALGIGDNQALTALNEAIGVEGCKVVVMPQANADKRRHPMWETHVTTLTGAGVVVVSDVAPGRLLDLLDT
ncbi:flavoprotein [Lentzea jiangxiensis]|uniref:Flavoprotein n=1 Tax=Lentzea jiangxiensis TaxID=641025 RepID=A0A1H0Q1A5_9PSEU|nr:flavoprotein [Lentzea jiangxiensis]SDP10840.1 Flavoprotein [Lentzea jiangxiensis]